MLDSLAKLVLLEPHIAKHFCESVLNIEIEVDTVIPGPSYIKFQKEQEDSLGNNLAKTEVDVFAKLSDGTRVIIEIQRAYQDYFIERSMFYSDKNFVDQFPTILAENKTHTAYKYFRPVYSINILEKSVFPDIKSPKVEFDVVSREHNQLLLNADGVPLKRYIFIQLDQYSPNMEDSQFKYWAEYWRNDKINSNADSPILDADNLIDETTWNEEVRKMVDAEIKAREDEKARLDTAENRGRAEGFAKGIAEAEAEAKERAEAILLANISRMILKGLRDDEISEMLDTPLQKVAQTRNELTPSGV